MQTMNIGAAARASGVSAKMIRHYEEIGRIPKAGRNLSGYRVYAEKELHSLRFVRQARNLGFSIDQIRQLLGLWQKNDRASHDVKKLAMGHLEALDERILELQQIRRTILHLVDHCHGDDRPDCPILENLAGDRPGGEVESRKARNRYT